MRLRTTSGDVDIELWPDKSPEVVAKFLKLCTDGSFNGKNLLHGEKTFAVVGMYTCWHLVVCDPFAESVPSGSSVKRDLKRKAKLNLLSFGDEMEAVDLRGAKKRKPDAAACIGIVPQTEKKLNFLSFGELGDEEKETTAMQEKSGDSFLLQVLCEDIHLRVNKFSTIKDVKDIISVRSKLTAQDQRLLYHGIELENGTCFDNGLQDDSIIYLEQRIVFRGAVLSDERWLNDYAIAEGSIVRVVAGQEFEIIVDDMMGYRTALEVKNTHSVLMIKQTLSMKKGIPADKMLLSFGGEYLEDERTLGSYRISLNSRLHLTLVGR
ncbi:hypothetical protein RJ639_046864 [Escallonia herrerae]|uniref:Ubiquitin-like domain-containing protein n=1 Tax=Escallonia herrerae TaxID=1293975 RepID=A0AA88W3L6_9ASTE|nr:hypothetical protein RJ639_046864 [Escallonia herrerae]